MSETVRKRRRFNIKPEDFVTAWTKADSAQEAADTLSKVCGVEVPRDIVLARASVYRAAGVNLKHMPRKNPRRLDLTSLNAIASPPAA